MDEKKYIEGDDLINIIIQIPRGTVKMAMTAKLLDGDKLVDAHSDFDTETIREMRQAFLDNVEDGDDYDKVYALTEEGKKSLGIE